MLMLLVNLCGIPVACICRNLYFAVFSMESHLWYMVTSSWDNTIVVSSVYSNEMLHVKASERRSSILGYYGGQ